MDLIRSYHFAGVSEMTGLAKAFGEGDEEQFAWQLQRFVRWIGRCGGGL